jgi:hypothetical protein
LSPSRLLTELEQIRQPNSSSSTSRRVVASGGLPLARMAAATVRPIQPEPLASYASAAAIPIAIEDKRENAVQDAVIIVTLALVHVSRVASSLVTESAAQCRGPRSLLSLLLFIANKSPAPVVKTADDLESTAAVPVKLRLIAGTGQRWIPPPAPVSFAPAAPLARAISTISSINGIDTCSAFSSRERYSSASPAAHSLPCPARRHTRD